MPVTSHHIQSVSPPTPWQKTLYGNAGYPDNHTDITFLKDLQTNKHVRQFSYGEAIAGAARLTHQISSCCLFLRIFHAMYTQQIRAESVLAYSTVGTLFSYVLFISLPQQQRGGQDPTPRRILDHGKTVLAVLVSGYILAPMMHTLTDSISTDTIFTVTFVVLLVHLIFFDYGLPAFVASNAISLNAALFGSICLASRLPTAFDAFALLCVAAEFFVLLPRLVQQLWHPALVTPWMAACVWTLSAPQSSSVLLGLYALGAVLVNALCPAVFVHMQQYKKTIHGPWDEAIVKDSDMGQHHSRSNQQRRNGERGESERKICDDNL